MSINASDVKKLREITGAGMMACKQALSATGGDLEKAIDELRKKGLAQAEKKQSRIAAEGTVVTLVEGGLGVVLEVNCETDFVSKGDDFKSFAESVGQVVLKNRPADVTALLDAKLANGKTVKEGATELTLKCGEKVDVRRFQILEVSGEGTVAAYNHGGRIGVLVGAQTTNGVANKAETTELLKDVCMHVAAASPQFMKGDDIDEGFKKREAEIYKAQLLEQGKPENMIDKILIGKMNKLASEVCLLEQKFVKDPDISIQQLLTQKAKEIGGEVTLSTFIKINLGEGIEKKEDNLAEEVAKLTKQ